MHSTYRAEEFRQQEVMVASPMRLVVMAYDLAIFACEQKDYNRATKTVSVLRDALGYEYGEVALGLLGLYQWCLDCIRNEDYYNAMKTLIELRDAWATVEKQLTSVSQEVAEKGINSSKNPIKG